MMYSARDVSKCEVGGLFACLATAPSTAAGALPYYHDPIQAREYPQTCALVHLTNDASLRGHAVGWTRQFCALAHLIIGTSHSTCAMVYVIRMIPCVCMVRYKMYELEFDWTSVSWDNERLNTSSRREMIISMLNSSPVESVTTQLKEHSPLFPARAMED
jgi:hypothetical protein